VAVGLLAIRRRRCWRWDPPARRRDRWLSHRPTYALRICRCRWPC